MSNEVGDEFMRWIRVGNELDMRYYELLGRPNQVQWKENVWCRQKMGIGVCKER